MNLMGAGDGAYLDHGESDRSRLRGYPMQGVFTADLSRHSAYRWPEESE